MSREKNDGGPAYPRKGHRVQPAGKTYFETIEAQDGMSLRDHFAGLAMQAMLGNCGSLCSHVKTAELAYSMADAMLKAREQ
jgi:hypothetical protein